MTKAMTAAMIGELVAEGKLDWDKTPVVEYVPTAEFSPILTPQLTLSDYLSHRTVRSLVLYLLVQPLDTFQWQLCLNFHYSPYHRVSLMTNPHGLSLKRPTLRYTVASSTSSSATG